MQIVPDSLEEGKLTVSPANLTNLKYHPILYARLVGEHFGTWVYKIEKRRHVWLTSAMRYLRIH